MKPLTTLSLLCAAALCIQADVQADQQIIKNDDSAVATTSRLVKLDDANAAKWVSEFQILDFIKQGTRFMDITDHKEDENLVMTTREDKVPTSISNQDEANLLIQKLETTFMQQWLEKFTSFYTRYYKSSWGAQSSAWLIETVREIAAPAGASITVNEFKHEWSQFSIIARFEGSKSELENEAVVIGAHQDSVNQWFPSLGRSPGADDDGSGTVTILEVFRVLVENGFQPERPVEFHWYSAEEGGLLGSQAIAKQYYKEGREITAMIQNDMTGYVLDAQTEVIGLVTDYVNEKLTNFIRQLIETYATIPAAETECGYACSDHASWRKYGYPSSFMIEDKFEKTNQRIHTLDDNIKYLSFDHMLQFSRVLVGFAVEASHA
ncbi:hypothetical protein BDA99DRAFT_515992 [Phascolomyces articulosus]|uniref:Peptide hydrolase n=1 Tax=Phascolomyces articulosus TaxID=60185 RepID=A0AAD5K5X8_9FUNG|nr:hypothetical protein BDA99DRAFT_515992 [Phascolomyces articulosus]